jgi:hypothetical protein
MEREHPSGGVGFARVTTDSPKLRNSHERSTLFKTDFLSLVSTLYKHTASSADT